MTRTEQLGRRLLELGNVVSEHVQGLFLDPSARTFWLGGLVTVAIVCVLLWARGSTGLRARQLWNGSARVDYGLILAKPVLATVIGLPALLSTLGVAMATIRALQRFGPTGMLSSAVSPLLVTVVYTVVLFLAWDFSRFALHWAMHRSTLLWQFHQVHHSATTLTPLTLYRVHPLESLLYRLRGVLVTGVLTGAFSFLFGPRTVELQLWGVNALGFAFSVVSGNLRHSHLRWSFGPRVERWLISPAQHQLHHGAAAADCGSNLGTWLAVWDRIAGSHRFAQDRDVQFGLPAEVCNHRADSTLSALLDPILACGTRMLSWPRTFGAAALLLLAATFNQNFG